ncbi:protein C2-DOMAIN ABA-RELATED 11 [Canna indica]|uniref:Protein C2-DOMAIN ABA-RELATED 11 n=1 Tax=Canna indica TaxID=4628 RepID=A0AAQ3L334_9LILI|nr:protein C2-DOMAIN ABA-RELATED 11 [Canna indica]
MEESGVLKVNIVRGKKLVVRDFMSSDPYVVVKLGNQAAKTKVVKSCLNPVWNDEFSFNIKERFGVLELEVFDRNRFTSDDKMGHAFLNLQPLVSCSKLRRVLQLTTGETKLRKVAPEIDNCLLTGSFIMNKNGEIVLDACLKLLDVESGELYVTVKFIEHPTAKNLEKPDCKMHI